MPELRNRRHEIFCQVYVANNANGTQAYMVAYPKCNLQAAYRAASRLLRVGEVSARVDELWKEKHISITEAVSILADHAHGDIGMFLDDNNIINLKEARENGKTRLIKKIKQTTTTYIAKKPSDEDREVSHLEIELHDPQAALDKILRVHGAYKDKTELDFSDRLLARIDNVNDALNKAYGSTDQSDASGKVRTDSA